MPPYPFAWRYAAREVLRRPARSLMTLVGIVLGVAAATAVSLGTSGTRTAYPGMFTLLAGRAALELRGAEGSVPFLPRLDEVAAVEGVAAALPVIQQPAALAAPAGPVPLLLFGVHPENDGEARDYRVRTGEPLGAGRRLWLEVGFAARHGLKVGDPVKVLTARGPAELPVAGLLEPGGPARFNGGAVAVVPLETAQALLGLPGRVNTVSVIVSPGARPEAVRRRLAEAFPELVAGPPAERGTLAAEFLGNINQALSSLGAFAIIAGALVILNTFLMHLNERQAQLALLRALGATRAQVQGLLLRQALLLGGAGTLIGLPLGVLLAWLLLRLHESFLGVPMAGLTLSWRVLLLAALLGPLMTLAATVLPARRASRREPLAGLRQRGPATDLPARGPAAVGFVLIAAVGLFLAAVIRGWLSAPVGTSLLPLVSGFAMLGCACLLPLVQGPLLRGLGAVIGRLLGVEGRLAVRQLLRHRARTGLTVGVLFAAVVAAISFGVSLLNNSHDIRAWFRHSVDADFLVRAVRPDPAVILTPAPLPPEAQEDVRDAPGVAKVGRLRFVPVRTEGVALVILARDLDADGPLPL